MVFACAHRGLSSEVAENTLAAFQAAAAAGFQGFEMDLQLSADGQVIVLHDDGLERTTNGRGRAAELRYDEIRQYDTGVGPVPRLDDLFAALREWKGTWNLEIKGKDATIPALDLVRRHGLAKRTIMTSFDAKALAVAQRVAPDVARGLLVFGSPDERDIADAKAIGATWLNVDQDGLTKADVEAIQAGNLQVGAWTVNDPERAQQLAGWGVDCIITDRRDVMQALTQAVAR